VEGRLRQDRWEKDGKTQSRVRISANNIHFMPKKRDDLPGQSGRPEMDSPSQVPPAENAAPENVAWDE
ncbi:MAG: hypothetical protein WC552_08890, partial [Candidatus Omnitrophota bacterium]